MIDVWVEDEHGLRTASVERHRPCTVHVSAELHGGAVDPVIGFTIGNESLPQLFSTSSEQNGASGTFGAGERVELVAELELPLAPGGYSISPWVAHARGGRPMMDHREGLGSITVTGIARQHRADGHRPQGAAGEGGEGLMSVAPMYEMTGPSAMSGDWRRFAYLTRTLAVTDFKVRFYDSALGYLWTLIRPLLFFGVLFVVFSVIVKVGEGVEHYPAMLISGIVLFFFFAESTTQQRHERGGQRAAGPQDPLPPAGDPAVRGAHQRALPRPQPRRGPGVLRHRRRRGALELVAADSRCWCFSSCSRWAYRRSSRCSSCPPATSSRSGRW